MGWCEGIESRAPDGENLMPRRTARRCSTASARCRSTPECLSDIRGKTEANHTTRDKPTKNSANGTGNSRRQSHSRLEGKAPQCRNESSDRRAPVRLSPRLMDRHTPSQSCARNEPERGGGGGAVRAGRLTCDCGFSFVEEIEAGPQRVLVVALGEGGEHRTHDCQRAFALRQACLPPRARRSGCPAWCRRRC